MRPAVRRSQRIQRVLKRRNRTTGRMVRRHRARQSPKLPPVFPRHHLTDIQLRILLYEPSLTCKPPRNRKAGIELLPEDRLDCLIPRPLRATKRRRPKASRVLKKNRQAERSLGTAAPEEVTKGYWKAPSHVGLRRAWSHRSGCHRVAGSYRASPLSRTKSAVVLWDWLLIAGR